MSTPLQVFIAQCLDTGMGMTLLLSPTMRIPFGGLGLPCSFHEHLFDPKM
jgi:hypothetical protein